ncbi:ubiquinol-cytochrome c reductase iron-sulfur subunit [Paenibacillus sp. 32O-W]|uniref:QcrA and Rieske domain-containing protein n=1 Tax=Paenibacillus sp. 32O-W TaxID=1695218 RepID=UPI0016435A73|nr:ubiquinol-cytochrome c reductase iron-sulfur subunit [Paenibacillus sp. 32O-W]
MENSGQRIKISRRRFLGTAGKLVLGITGYAALSGTVFYLGAKSSSAARKPKQEMKPANLALLGEESDFSDIKDTVKVEYDVEIEDGWVKQKRHGFVYVTRSEDGELLIMSPICTHLGCNVTTASDKDRLEKPGLAFICPCHGGEYDNTGRHIGGPPPRPLDVFEPIVREGKVYIAVLHPGQRK